MEKNDETTSEAFPFVLTRGKRIFIAVVAFALASVNQFYFKLDPITLTLVGIGFFILFAKIEKFSVAGMEGSIHAEQEKVAKVKTPAPVEPPKEPVLEVASSEQIAVTDVATVKLTVSPPSVHYSDYLRPPSDSGELLLWAVENIGNELIILAGNSGQSTSIPNTFPRVAVKGLSALASDLASRKIIPEDLLSSIQLTVRTRNALVHGQLTEDTLGSAADLSAQVLVKLRKIPRYYYRVMRSSVGLFKDGSLAVPHDTDGVMIASIGDDENVKAEKVFPRATEYKVGRFVTWEWNMTGVLREEGWFEHPTTGRPELAFSSSATFAGREYPDQWGIMYRLRDPEVGLLERKLP